MSGLFYNLGRMVGPQVRKAKWVWQSLTADQTDSIKAEYEVGLDLAHEIRIQSTLDTDPRSGQIVNELGHHLTAHLTNKLRKFSFEVIAAPEPNAFALPGGFIFITRSLLELCDWNPDEIAFILAHEMSHVIRGHAMNRIITNSAIAAGARAAALRTPLAAWLGKVGVKFLQSAYSQDMELQADTLGARLAAAAARDPNAPAQLLARLSQIKQPAGQPILGEYFSSHPAFDIRIKNVNRIPNRQGRIAKV